MFFDVRNTHENDSENLSASQMFRSSRAASLSLLAAYLCSFMLFLFVKLGSTPSGLVCWAIGVHYLTSYLCYDLLRWCSVLLLCCMMYSVATAPWCSVFLLYCAIFSAATVLWCSVLLLLCNNKCRNSAVVFSMTTVLGNVPYGCSGVMCSLFTVEYHAEFCFTGDQY